MQINYVDYESRIPGYEALGYCAPSSSAFVVRADALQKCNWLPMHTRTPHLALGQELKLQEYLSHFINEPLAVGECGQPLALRCAGAELCCALPCCAGAVCAVLLLIFCLHFDVLCHDVLCHDVPCCAVLCHAVPCW